MKRLSTIAILALYLICGLTLASPIAQAQTYERSPVGARPKIKLHAEYGVRGGLCFAGITGDITKTYSQTDGSLSRIYTWPPTMVTGATAGGFVSVRLTPKFYFQTEIFLSMKGFQSRDGMEKVTLFYFDFPFLLKYRLPVMDSARAHIFAGPVLNLLTGARRTRGNDSWGVVNDFQKYDLGTVLGADLQLPSGTGYFIIDLRYGYGFISVDNTRGKLDMANRALSLTIGFNL